MLDLRNEEETIVSGNSILLSEEQIYIMELEAENARLRQQLEADNKKIDLQNVKMNMAP